MYAPAWEGATRHYDMPFTAMHDPRTLPMDLSPRFAQRQQQNDLAQFAMQREAGRNEVNTPPGTYFGQDTLEMTGLPSIARGVGHLRDGEPGEALPEMALGGLGVFGMVGGGGGRVPRVRGEAPVTLPTSEMPGYLAYRGMRGAASGEPIGAQPEWWSDSPELASEFASAGDGLGANVTRETLHGQNVLSVDAGGEPWIRIPIERVPPGPVRDSLASYGATVTADDLAHYARQGGHDILRIENVVDSANHAAPARTATHYARLRPPPRIPRIPRTLPEIPTERLPNAPAHLPGRATDGSVLPIRPPEPIRQSMVGGSDDLAETARMQPATPPGIIRNPNESQLATLAERGDEMKYVMDTEGNVYAFSAADMHHNQAMRALRDSGVQVRPLGPGAEVTDPDAAGFIWRNSDGSFVHEDANMRESGPFSAFQRRMQPDAGGGQGENGAIRVYHGSPHSFDSFSLDHFGTGEGNARFGYGVYVAENRGVGRSYQESLAPHLRVVGDEVFDAQNPMHLAADAVERAQGSRLDAIHDLQARTRAAGGSRTPEGRLNSRAIRAINDSIDGAGLLPRVTGQRGASNLYEADLNVTPAQVIDLDTPWAHQPPRVRETLGEYMPDGATHMDDLYQNMIDILGSPKAAAEVMRQRGFRALAYFDQGSRAEGAGTRNYVVFDEAALTTRTRNGEQIGRAQPDGGSAQIGFGTTPFFRGAVHEVDASKGPNGLAFFTPSREFAGEFPRALPAEQRQVGEYRLRENQLADFRNAETQQRVLAELADDADATDHLRRRIAQMGDKATGHIDWVISADPAIRDAIERAGYSGMWLDEGRGQASVAVFRNADVRPVRAQPNAGPPRPPPRTLPRRPTQ